MYKSLNCHVVISSEANMFAATLHSCLGLLSLMMQYMIVGFAQGYVIDRLVLMWNTANKAIFSDVTYIFSMLAWFQQVSHFCYNQFH